MSTSYRVVQWNRHKRIYDLVLGGVIGLAVASFLGISLASTEVSNRPSAEILAIRALGATAAALLTLVLCIGPLARLDRRFAVLLYNRRHLGVATALVAILHGGLSLVWYHGFGALDPLVSVLSSGASGPEPSFQPFGVLALAILLLLAATSHDFWLSWLGPRVWKNLHMLVYPAWLALIAHVAFGAMQTGGTPWFAWVMGILVVIVAGLHVAAGLASRATEGLAPQLGEEWLDAGDFASLVDGRARAVLTPGGHPIAVYRVGNRVAAVDGVCIHQGGPLAEGRILDGCVTCPWHGYQFRPEDGRSPPPFADRVSTYRSRVVAGRIQVRSTPDESGEGSR
ncbi:MAG: Rieske 2Fe-2S domain-containing protein [Planctomycetota bacterium]